MLLTGWVHFVEDGEELSMSKRAGTFITLDDLLAELGVDAARWYFASRGANVNMDVDIEVGARGSRARTRSSTCSTRTRASPRSCARRPRPASRQRHPSRAARGRAGGHAGEIVARFPEVVEDAAAAQETQGVTTYATELATAFHAFYRDARVVDLEAAERSAQRLALVDATRISLANALGLLGISAPDAM